MHAPRRTPVASAALATLALIALGATQALAQTPAPTPAPTPTPGAADQKKEAREEATAPQTIVITATGRNTTASKTPYNVSALSGDALREGNITDVKKLISQSVGISAPENSARFADSVTVRGLNISPVNANNLESFVRSTLSYYLDDTPLPNIGYRIKDIARVETLLGPQGTLYGAGSLGGTIRYITNQPQLGRLEGRVNTSFYQTKNGGLSTDVDGVVNVPLGTSVALRAALSTLDEKGYTDRVSNPPWRTGSDAWTTQPNPGKNVYEDDDWQRVDGGRLSLLWQVTPGFKLSFAHTRQNQLANGTSAVSLLPLGVANARDAAERDAAWQDPNLDEGNTSIGGLPCNPNCTYNDRFFTPPAVNKNTVLSRYPEFARRKFDMDSIDLDWDLGFAALHSSTSRFKDTRKGQADYASAGWSFYAPEGPILGGFDLGGSITSDRSAYITFDNSFKGVSHETRLTSKGDGPLGWIAGLYYTKQDRSFLFSEVLPGINDYISGLGNGPTFTDGGVDEGYRETTASTYKEKAVYGELSYKVTPQWTVSAGARLFSYDDTIRAVLKDYAGGAIDITRDDTTSDDGKSYFRLNSSFQLNPDLLVYATFSQGFRRGGTNPFRNRGSAVQRIVREDIKNYGADSTNNFEVGVKGSLLDRTVYVEASIYRIDWKDPQTFFEQLVSGFPVNGTANGPDARSNGLDLSARWRVTQDWTLSWAATTTEGKWADTKTQCLYEALNSAGDQLTTEQQACRTWTKGGNLGGTAKWKHNLGVRYARLLENDMYLSASLGARYLGSVRQNRSDDPLDNNAIRTFPSITRYNASVGLSRDAWDVQLWIENLTNERALVSGQASGIMGERVILTTPRTIGLNASYKF
jgi:iron complex outermembrane recepter protein